MLFLLQVAVDRELILGFLLILKEPPQFRGLTDPDLPRYQDTGLAPTARHLQSKPPVKPFGTAFVTRFPFTTSGARPSLGVQAAEDCS